MIREPLNEQRNCFFRFLVVNEATNPCGGIELQEFSLHPLQRLRCFVSFPTDAQIVHRFSPVLCAQNRPFNEPLAPKQRFHFKLKNVQAIVGLHLLNFSMESRTSDDV